MQGIGGNTIIGFRYIEQTVIAHFREELNIRTHRFQCKLINRIVDRIIGGEGGAHIRHSGAIDLHVTTSTLGTPLPFYHHHQVISLVSEIDGDVAPAVRIQTHRPGKYKRGIGEILVPNLIGRDGGVGGVFHINTQSTRSGTRGNRQLGSDFESDARKHFLTGQDFRRGIEGRGTMMTVSTRQTEVTQGSAVADRRHNIARDRAACTAEKGHIRTIDISGKHSWRSVVVTLTRSSVHATARIAAINAHWAAATGAVLITADTVEKHEEIAIARHELEIHRNDDSAILIRDDANLIIINELRP